MTSRRQLLAGAAALWLGRRAWAAPESAQIDKSVLITMLPEELSYEERFRLAADAGFRHMEVQTVDETSEAEAIHKAAKAAGLRIHSVMNMAHWKYPLSSPDPEVVKVSMEGMRASLRQAKLYGADAVLLVPAVVQPDTTYERAWERSQKQVRELIPLAGELGVVIAIENVWNKFLLTARDFVQYIDEFDSPWVRAYFDVGNIVHYGYPEQWIRKIGDRLVKVHLKDYDREHREFVNLGEGDVDWEAVRTALDEAGYQGAATVELRGGDREYLADVSRRVDRLLKLA